ncbi:GTP-binding domain [Pseudomonas phage Iggy]|uniref:YspA cpYpsA-related SLOG domain-containing protein n=1 Tax=Pseudomonas phage Iggy TaxID=2592193 RepID=A0A7S5AYV1_9CAUD|nr:GTP-binding domain [Pseudomonas phage Iggy]QEA09762.1 hypothetical protein [Pseudomonas phage Iggy]
MKQRVLVCGGRQFADWQHLCCVMALVAPWCAARPLLIHGGAPGADTLAGRWAALNGWPCAVVAANWDFYGKAAGSLRNQWMLSMLEPDLVVALPGGVGTAHMVRIARKAGVDVYVASTGQV